VKKVIFVIGATATGKTDLGIQIAKKIGGSIISADSRQMYIDMTIGTAKPAIRPGFEDINSPRKDTKDLWKIPFAIEGVDHYLFDIAYPDERYTVFDFQQQALHLIEKLDNPVVVGGTGLYVDSLINNYILDTNSEDSRQSQQIRGRLEQEYQELVQKLGESGAKQAMWDKLNLIDPETARETHPNNWRYVGRALELHELTGKTKKDLAQKTPPAFEYELRSIDFPRDELYARIERRIDIQMDQGLLEETKTLFAKYPPSTPALSSLGYLELKQYLDGNLSLEDAIDLFKKNTRHFAKRQLSWFRRYGIKC
jgi:tRNA dimethylallyltransferase